MNKKFSTLMAGSLLAGALFVPSNLLAQVKYANGNTYASVTADDEEPSASNKTGFIVLSVGGKDYVATVTDGNALLAVPFGEATLANTVKVTESASNTTFENADGDKLGFNGTPNDFGNTTVNFTDVDFDPAAFKIATAAGSVSLTDATFGVVGNANSTFAAKFVAESALETDYPSTIVTGKLSSAYYMLMVDGKALKGGTYSSATAGVEAFDKVNDESDQAFYWSIELDKVKNVATFKNKKTEEYLKDDAGVLVVAALNTAQDGLTNAGVEVVGLKLSTNIATPATFDGVTGGNIRLGAVPSNKLEASELQLIYGASFNADIKRTEGNKALANNPFTGNLQPVQWADFDAGYKLKAADAADTEFMLLNGDGKIIVMQTTDQYAAASGNKDYAYKVIAITPKELGTALKGNASAKALYASMFSIYASSTFAAGVNEAVDRFVVTGDQTNGSSVANEFQIGSITLNKVPTLAAENVNLPVYLDAVTIKLTKFTTIDVKELLKTPNFFTVKNVNTKKTYAATEANFGKVLGLNGKGEIAYVKPADALVGYPETQWAITTTDGTILTFKNRETPDAEIKDGGDFELTANQLYKVDGRPNVYAIVPESGLAAIDTIEIAPLDSYAESDGYKRFDADWLKDQLFYLGSYSSVRGVAYVTENHKNNHQVGMEKEQENASGWHVAALMYQNKDSWGNPEGALVADTIRIESALGYWDADAKAFTTTKADDVDANDTYLKFPVYSFKNDEHNEYLAYDAARTRYTTGDEGQIDGYKDLADANYFALKIMGGDSTKYNLILVDPEMDGDYADELYSDVQPAEKVYTGDSADKGLLNFVDMYDQTENDLFSLDPKDAPEYVKLAQGNVIKIYREETESEVLYQKGEFLGIGNAVEFNKINPALYVDTVYYNRGANNRWEYLLGININRVDTTYKCDEPSHANLMHKADTTFGAFLVNYADSAIVEDTRDVHANKYVYDNGKRYAKLGFEEGYRTNDTLYVERADGKFDKIEVGAPSRQLVKFAFRVMDHNANTFIIETGYKYPEAKEDRSDEPETGYLRWINGNVVVTDLMEDAEVFSLKADDRNPVANEAIDASSISVVATDGGVIISGAQGKKVTITNVLGQTIANTVITSNEATISAPAGVVVVAVEGEAAVKAIVK